MQYAKIENGIVSNVILADAEFVATQPGTWVLDTVGAGVGWTYANGVFATPVVQAPVVAPVRTLTKLAYMQRFTDAELAGIYTTAKTVVQVEIWLEKFKLASEINLDDPYTIGGLQAMEAAGLLAAGRAAEILG